MRKIFALAGSVIATATIWSFSSTALMGQRVSAAEAQTLRGGACCQYFKSISCPKGYCAANDAYTGAQQSDSGSQKGLSNGDVTCGGVAACSHYSSGVWYDCDH
jgi:hypothetical protein